jgi:hypothetical protein
LTVIILMEASVSDPPRSSGKRELSSPHVETILDKSSGQTYIVKKRPSSGQAIHSQKTQSRYSSNQAITTSPQLQSPGQQMQVESAQSPHVSSNTSKSLYNFVELRGRYRIICKLDSGTFADVWKGEKICQEGDEPPKNRYVAIKRLHSISSRRRTNEIRIL